MKVMRYVGVFMLFIVAGYFGMISMAPSELEYTVNEDINASIDQVFDAIHSPKDMTQWMTGLESVKQTKGDGPSISSTYDLFYPQDMVLHRTFKVFEPHKRIALEGEVTDFFKRLDDYTLESLDSNTTRISWRVKMEALSMQSKMIFKAADSHKKNTKENLSALKKLLENR